MEPLAALQPWTLARGRLVHVVVEGQKLVQTFDRWGEETSLRGCVTKTSLSLSIHQKSSQEQRRCSSRIRLDGKRAEPLMKRWKAIIIIIIITTIIFLPNNRAAQNFINIAWRDAGAIRGKMTAFLRRRRLTDVQEQRRRVSGAKPSPRYPSRSFLLSCASRLHFLLHIRELNKLQLSCGDS